MGGVAVQPPGDPFVTETREAAELILPPAEPVVSSSTAELRTFLFADIRGYTRFTHERGDEAAAQLVAKFAGLMRQVVEARGGAVLELRGDEALAVFSSARQALRAAVDLQARFADETEKDPSLPLPVGIGLDAGEAVPVEGGYRGEALNLAARLCNLAGPGQILATEGVVYLGRTVRGVSYADHGHVPIKGFADYVPVKLVLRSPDSAEPAAGEAPAAGLAPRPVEPSGRADMELPIGGFLGALPSGVLVGREKEWERIMAQLEAVMQGTGRLVLLAGEPGIG
jgi:class 3 adenylate cyclase